MIKLIATDLDGTMLINPFEYSQRTEEVIKKVKEKGISLAIATGRLFPSAAVFAKKLKTDFYIISSNGAYVKNIANGEILVDQIMDADKLYKYVEYLDKENSNYFLYGEDCLYSKENSTIIPFYAKANKYLDDEQKIVVEKHKNFDKIVGKKPIYKIIIIEKDDSLRNKWKQEVEKFNDMEISQSSPINIEIMSEGISKGSGLKAVCNKTGVNLDEVIAIGDHINDLPMINIAGVGVAMGNANEEVKKSANFVTLTNIEDGFAYAIEKYI